MLGNIFANALLIMYHKSLLKVDDSTGISFCAESGIGGDENSDAKTGPDRRKIIRIKMTTFLILLPISPQLIQAFL